MENNQADHEPQKNEEAGLEGRRAFLRKWSKAVLAGLLGLGIFEEAAQDSDAAWVNRYGGGGWANRAGGGGWANRAGGGWANAVPGRAGGWINNRGGGGGWANRYGGGGWANRAGPGGWANRRR